MVFTFCPSFTRVRVCSPAGSFTLNSGVEPSTSRPAETFVHGVVLSERKPGPEASATGVVFGLVVGVVTEPTGVPGRSGVSATSSGFASPAPRAGSSRSSRL